MSLNISCFPSWCLFWERRRIFPRLPYPTEVRRVFCHLLSPYTFPELYHLCHRSDFFRLPCLCTWSAVCQEFSLLLHVFFKTPIHPSKPNSDFHLCAGLWDTRRKDAVPTSRHAHSPEHDDPHLPEKSTIRGSLILEHSGRLGMWLGLLELMPSVPPQISNCRAALPEHRPARFAAVHRPARGLPGKSVKRCVLLRRTGAVWLCYWMALAWQRFLQPGAVPSANTPHCNIYEVLLLAEHRENHSLPF